MVESCAPPTGDLAHNPGMCPNWESTGDLLARGAVLNPLSYTSQGYTSFLILGMFYFQTGYGIHIHMRFIIYTFHILYFRCLIYEILHLNIYMLLQIPKYIKAITGRKPVAQTTLSPEGWEWERTQWDSWTSCVPVPVPLEQRFSTGVPHEFKKICNT